MGKHPRDDLPPGLSLTFAERELHKMGWQKGRGLGRNGHGIQKAIKVGHKMDTTGLGKGSDDWTVKWWDHVFNRATAQISVGRGEDGVVVIGTRELTVTEKKEASVSMLYRNFVPARQTGFDPKKTLEYEPVDEEDHEKYRTKLTDREVFEACGGRTAHKGARATVVGKLSRVDPGKLLENKENGDISSSEDEFEVRARIIAEEMSGVKRMVAKKVVERAVLPAPSAAEQVIPERWARGRVDEGVSEESLAENPAEEDVTDAKESRKRTKRRLKDSETDEQRVERKRQRKEGKRRLREQIVVEVEASEEEVVETKDERKRRRKEEKRRKRAEE